MRSPFCPLNRFCSRSRERKCGPPVHSLHPFLMEMNAPCTDKYTHTHTLCAVGAGQGCSRQRGRLTSENPLSKAHDSYTTVGETANEKARGPGQKGFFPPFQGKMPKPIKTASLTEWRKQMFSSSGLRRVREKGNVFRETP